MPERRWAMLVGASAYEFHTPLKFSAADAADFADALVSHLGFTRETILLLTDVAEHQAHREPRRNDIFHSLGLLANPESDFYVERELSAIEEDDLFLFYFSGHGLRTPEGEEFLLSVDASNEDVSGTAVPLAEVEKRIASLPCKHKVLFIDACRAELDEGEGAKAAGTSLGIGDRKPSREGVAKFYSCDPLGRSYEIDDDDVRHGSFTHCMLGAVRDPTVNTLRELNEYLASRVPKLNVDRGKKPQKPFFVPNPAEMEELRLFAVLERRPDIDELMSRVNELGKSGDLEYEWWDKISSTLDGPEAVNPIKLELLNRFLGDEMTFEDFETRWKRMERRSPGVRQTGPTVRVSGEASRSVPDA